MKQISTEIIQRREVMGNTAQKNSGKTYCPYSLIFDLTTYVLWPSGFQVLSSPKRKNSIFKRSMGGGVKGLCCQLSPGEGTTQRWGGTQIIL